MNKKFLIVALILIALVICVLVVRGVNQKEENDNTNQTQKTEEKQNDVQTKSKEKEKEESKGNQTENKTGTAGSNIPLKDNLDEAKKQIEVAMKQWIEEVYGDEVVDAKFNIKKVYSAEEEQKNEALKELKLGPNEVAFEVDYELKIAEDVKDYIKFTIPSGDYDEQTRWVTNKSNVGILRPDGDNYKVTDLGTGW